MKTRAVRYFALVVCAITPLAAYSASSSLCSVFAESYAALQQQLTQGAEVFESPQIGTLPMLLTLTLPGAAYINPDRPIALHVFNTDAGQVAFVLETTSVETPEAYVQAVQGDAIQPPDSATGIYLFEGGAARIVDGRVLLSPHVADLEACTGKDAAPLPTLPEIPGTIRILLSPSAIKPWLERAKDAAVSLTQMDAPNAAETQRSLNATIDFYQDIFEQIAWLQIGIGVNKEGLVVDTRTALKKGSDLYTLAASTQSVTPQYLAFLEKDILFGLAMGSYTLPQALHDRIVKLYAQMLPQVTAMDENPIDIAALMGAAGLGAPFVMTATLSTNTVLAQGVIGVADAAGYLNEQVAILKTPEFKTLMSHVGMTVVESPTRNYKGIKIHPFIPRLDEESFKKNLRDKLAVKGSTEIADTDLDGPLEAMRVMFKLFGSGYEYATTDSALVFGSGLPSMIEQVIDRMRAPTQTTGEAQRIQTALQLPAAPSSIGRFSLSSFSRLGLTLANILTPDAIAALPSGDGISFAQWVTDGAVHSRLLLPPSEVKAIKATAQAAIKAQNDMFSADEEPAAGTPALAVPPALE